MGYRTWNFFQKKGGRGSEHGTQGGGGFMSVPIYFFFDKKKCLKPLCHKAFQTFNAYRNTERPWGVSWSPPGPFQAPRQHTCSKGNFAPAGATRAALERAPWTPPNFLLSLRSKQEPPPNGTAAPLHSVFRVTLSRVRGSILYSCPLKPLQAPVRRF